MHYPISEFKDSLSLYEASMFFHKNAKFERKNCCIMLSVFQNIRKFMFYSRYKDIAEINYHLILWGISMSYRNDPKFSDR